MYVLFYVGEVIAFVDIYLTERFINMGRVLKCAFAYDLSLTVLR